MNKSAPKSRVTVVRPPLKTLQDERTRAHRAINWVVSVILVAFAVWSISLNAQGRSMLKQTTLLVEQMDAKIESVTQAVQSLKDACTSPTIVIPTTTTDGEKNQ